MALLVHIVHHDPGGTPVPPQYREESLERQLGCRLVLKIETLNPIHSFKGRGACYHAAGMKPNTELVCASAGNFGQAMAYACRSRGLRLVVYASTNANLLKVERMRGFGAEVRQHGDDFDAAKLEAKRFAAQSGMRFVEDSLDPATCEGAGTIGIELLRWPQAFDTVLLALGNGGLLTGVGRWIKAHSPKTRAIGVGSRGAPAMAESWRAGRIIEHAQIHTIADGIGVRVPIPEALGAMQGIVDDVVLVSDETLLAAMKLLHRHVGIVVEPSGAAGVAAIIENRERFKDQLVATVICGGNLTPEQTDKWLV
jgi:threonine dehydratase